MLFFIHTAEPEEPLEIPPPLTDEWESKSPDTTSSEYHSFEGDIEDKMEDDIQPTAENFYNDSEMSRLNQSVFEFSSDSDDIFSDWRFQYSQVRDVCLVYLALESKITK